MGGETMTDLIQLPSGAVIDVGHIAMITTPDNNGICRVYFKRDDLKGFIVADDVAAIMEHVRRATSRADVLRTWSPSVKAWDEGSEDL